MKYSISAARFAVAALMLSAVTTSYLHTWFTHGDTWPWDYFGYFTNQNNLAEGFGLVAAAIGMLQGRRIRWVEYLRGAVTTYIFIVGVVYWTLLAATSPNPIPWTNDVVHGIVPAYAVLDWLLVGDRAPLKWRNYWVIFPYGLLWLAVTLTRGASDGWVPYPFLDPASGYASVSVYCGAIVAIAGAVGVAAWGASRYRGLVLTGAPEPSGAGLVAPQRIAS
ncbi:Pr6Pr family membrane protein [Gryllotalpicola ginsengisoli]|uniref:Pr6Pr family membrane protein n=1 Tax=Gryllotalpicola ginsengisoli TaxID=444608 RepID=UPI0003B57852|nr:Pr6Pr family membrane protein [Gryllotalpicola ginsengisoli]